MQNTFNGVDEITANTPVVDETGGGPAKPEPTHEDIAKLAYRIWVGNGRPKGTALSDWFEAEAELAQHD
jgi:hypothetical protein